MKFHKKIPHKKINKAILKKEPIFFQLEDLGDGESEEGEEEEGQIEENNKNSNTLWDDLLFKIMNKKTSYDLFNLKDSI